jgi:hypothetical protein
MAISETSREKSQPSGTQVIFSWPKSWGRLNKVQAARFQDWPEVHELTQLERWAVHDAIEQTKKLVDIVPLAKRLHASGPTQPIRSRAPKRFAPANPSTRPWGCATYHRHWEDAPTWEPCPAAVGRACPTDPAIKNPQSASGARAAAPGCRAAEYTTAHRSRSGRTRPRQGRQRPVQAGRDHTFAIVSARAALLSAMSCSVQASM